MVQGGRWQQVYRFLVWFIYAPHCLATLATVRRETGSWKHVAAMTAYLFGLAYFCIVCYLSNCFLLLGVKAVKEVVYASISDYCGFSDLECYCCF